MQLSSIDGTGNLYELMFSEFIRLLLRDLGIRNYQPLLSTKKSYTLKEMCSFQLQVSLSMCETFVGTVGQRVN